MKLLLAAALLAVASAFAPPLSVRPQSAVRARISMDEEKKPEKKAPTRSPGEGNPFSAAGIAYSEANKDGGDAYQPRAISDATVVDVFQGTLETEDEPWHSTARINTVVGLSTLKCAPLHPPSPPFFCGRLGCRRALPTGSHAVRPPRPRLQGRDAVECCRQGRR